MTSGHRLPLCNLVATLQAPLLRWFTFPTLYTHTHPHQHLPATLPAHTPFTPHLPIYLPAHPTTRPFPIHTPPSHTCIFAPFATPHAAWIYRWTRVARWFFSATFPHRHLKGSFDDYGCRACLPRTRAITVHRYALARTVTFNTHIAGARLYPLPLPVLWLAFRAGLPTRTCLPSSILNRHYFRLPFLLTPFRAWTAVRSTTADHSARLPLNTT